MGLKISRKNNGKEDVVFEMPDPSARIQLSASGTRTAEIAANTNYMVPSYIVGSGRLQVFLDGVLCAGGADADTMSPTKKWELPGNLPRPFNSIKI